MVVSQNKTVSPVDPSSFARGTIRGSRRHLLLSVVWFTAVAGAVLASGASVLTVVVLAAICAGLIAYNLVRIRAATRALGSPQLAHDFVLAQKRSHLVRGRIYLIASPILLAGTGAGLAHEQPTPPPYAWAVFAFTGAVLVYGWIWWVRTLRRVKLWHAPPLTTPTAADSNVR